jgi:predicted lysophospholipase L1 biosynthesis ABC-type transport system permease subunit
MLSHALAQRGVDGAMVDEWWVDVAPGQARAYLAAHKSGAGQPPGRSAEVVAAQLQEAPLRVGTQAALWLAILASVLLAAVGFAVHSTASLRSRRLELAQLRAIGLSRRRLVALVAGESAMMCALGTLFGVSIGVLLAWLVGPLIAVSGTGTPPVPSVEVVVPWIGIIGLVAAVVLVLVLVVVIVARVQRFAEPADLLRAGEEQ